MNWRMLRGALATHPFRVALTSASLVAAFLLFGLLQGVSATLDAALNRLRVDRLLVNPRFQGPLPDTYADEIERVPGVTHLVWTQFLFGYYQDDKDRVLVIMTDPERFLQVRPEYQVSRADLDALKNNRNGLIVLDITAADQCITGGQPGFACRERASRLELSGYVVLDLRAGMQIDANWRVDLSVNNVLDKYYYESVTDSSALPTRNEDFWYGAPRNYLLKIEAAF
jgi:hypothetical protein